ncbi:MAG: hypothetical protein CK425_06400 [Parachlamydia sp.]|nr:MAG: hypothetical protein CK425_06400 [Parachlamydia sp.]
MHTHRTEGAPLEWSPAYPADKTSPAEKKDLADLSEVKEKKSGKLTRARVILSSSASVKPSLRALGFMLAHKTTRGETSKMYKAKAVHSVFKLVDVWTKFYFGEDAIGKARNIGRKEMLANEEDFDAASELLDALRKEQGISNMSFRPESKIADGICAGIRLDIAQRHLCNGEDLADIIRSNEKGASKEAAANQAVYEILNANPESTSKKMLATLASLEQLSKCEGGNEAFHTDFNLVGQALVQADPILSANLPIYDDFAREYPLDQTNPKDLPHLIRALVDEQKARIIEHTTKAKSGEGEEVEAESWLHTKYQVFTIKDPVAFQQAVLVKINQDFNEAVQGKSGSEINQLAVQREKNIQVLNWTVAFLQLKEAADAAKFMPAAGTAAAHKPEPKFWNALGSKALAILGNKSASTSSLYDSISDPLMRHAIQSLSEDRADDTTYHTVASLRGIKLTSVMDVMGHSSMHTDASYLSNLPKLGEGMYSVSLDTRTGAHAITYVKVSENEGYILDPNGFQIRCKDAQHTIQQFKKLLKLYPEADEKSPSYQKREPDHHLAFQKMEAKK